MAKASKPCLPKLSKKYESWSTKNADLRLDLTQKDTPTEHIQINIINNGPIVLAKDMPELKEYMRIKKRKQMEKQKEIRKIVNFWMANYQFRKS